MIVAKYPPFRPLGYAKNPHWQTIGAFLARGKMSDYGARKHLVTLSDGDRIVVHDDQPVTWQPADRIVVLVHGLCGCHESPYMRRTSDKFLELGIRTIRVDMRGFGSSTLISKKHFHGGMSEDIKDVVQLAKQWSPLSKISVIGFSLGGNVVLKALGEWGSEAPENVDSAISVSPPVDLIWGSMNLRNRGNRIYDHYFMRRLRKQLFYRRRKVAGLADNGLNPIPERLVHFDDQFVAPVSGFKGARDYYELSSSGPLLKDIQIPTIIASSKDDPIVPFEMYAQFPMSPQVELIATSHGGHLGFLGRHSGDPDRFWLDWRVSHWISSLDK